MIIPQLDEPNLAYESGVHLGDGSLDKYRYLISGDKTKETIYYEGVLAPLVEELYSIKPTISFENNSVYLRIYSRELVLFKNQELGFPIGRKTGLRIPEFMASNPISTCNIISGLYDTDGSVKIRHDRSGDYPRISLAQKHQGLVADVKEALASYGITSTFYRNDYYDPRRLKVETRWFLDINGFDNYDLFASIVGTRSPYVRQRMAAIEDIR